MMLSCVDLSKSNPDLDFDGGTAPVKRHIRFGPFELRTDTRELSKFGTRIKLQSKPAQILETLVMHPGELVRREELCARLWPAGIFVDVESGLNTAVNRLRAALGDIVETPFYIETIPRLGYRFICSVQDVETQSAERDLLIRPSPRDETVLLDVHLLSNKFPENIVLRLVLAIVLVLLCEFVVFYLDLPAAISHACLIK